MRVSVFQDPSLVSLASNQLAVPEADGFFESALQVIKYASFCGTFLVLWMQVQIECIPISLH